MTFTPGGAPAPRSALTPEDLYREPNALARHYSRFRVAERLLFTGHSHQAWPDCGFDGQRRAWEDAARLVDAKWKEAFERADRVRAGYARLLGASGAPDDGDYALGGNTHELVIRFLSALPLRERPRLVTTDGEFHSIRRQLDRLEEEGLAVVRVPVDPIESLSERLSVAMDDRTAGVLVSAVLYRDARIVTGLDAVAARCERVGAHLLVDAYHALNAIPFDLSSLGLEGAFVVGGGYKYCQLGEGNCFLRVPPDCRLRPAVTGWFAEFSALHGGEDAGRVRYGPGAERFAGSTYDPTSHYRAEEVFRFFRRHGLMPDFLREVSRHQVRRLATGFDGLDLDPDLVDRDRETPLEAVGGFLALRTPQARALHEGLGARGVATDFRDDLLRLGPAPYLSDRQLDDAVAALGEAAAAVRSGGPS
ncbi:kynureninase [Candidatus Palauibacter sp.]|uniref:kynureninase/PvdN C-terminal domain-containing protein n=1 Tax=Candidatus Palauibacter sp. TaxID=3101350 RepID=UPI003B01A35B